MAKMDECISWSSLERETELECRKDESDVINETTIGCDVASCDL